MEDELHQDSLEEELYRIWSGELDSEDDCDDSDMEDGDIEQCRDECYFWINKLEEQKREMNMLLNGSVE